MNIEDKILGLVRDMPLLMTELEEKSELPMLEVIDAAIFLNKYELITTTPTEKGGGMVKITPRGLQLLNLPKLPEDETTGEEITEWNEEADEKDFEKQVHESVEEGEFSAAAIIAIKAREDERWRKIAEVKN